jgi:hypothetical protein
MLSREVIDLYSKNQTKYTNEIKRTLFLYAPFRIYQPSEKKAPPSYEFVNDKAGGTYSNNCAPKC